ncbi:MAG: exonuclease SbcCD subunit D [Nocardioides sp.]
MRILHTSDWHLGRSFHREGMLTHQAVYLDHLLETIDSEKVDLVIVAGDIYDRALPPVEAVALADETFARLARSRAQVVVTSGNHDSAQRLGFASRLIDASGVFIRADVRGVGTPVTLEDRHGAVAVHALPYLDPESVREPWGLSARSHEAALGHAMSLVRADLVGRRHTRSVVVAHAFVAGAAASESERDISVGGVSIVPTSAFEGIDYVALGHLHGRHRLTESIYYSGSPLAYSFSEADHRKGTWLADLAADGSITAEFVAAPVPRRLVRLRGDLEQLLTDPVLDADRDAWVQATLTDVGRPEQAMERLRKRFPHTLTLAFAGGLNDGRYVSTRSAGRTDHQIALDFVSAVRGTPATGSESAILQTACDACTDDPDLDHGVPDPVGAAARKARH